MLYGSTTGSSGPFTGGGPSDFYQIDPATGVATLIGAIGFDDVSAMAFHSVTRIIYAAGKRHADHVPVLISIDPTTGAGTEVGPIGPGRGISDIAFRPSDHVLYAHRINCPNQIYTIDIGTGVGTIVGPVTTNGCEGGDALEFSSTGTLYLAGTINTGSGPYTLYEVDQSTGATTPVVSLHYPDGGVSRANAMKFDPATGALIASVTTSFGGGGPNYLGSIDIVTGAVAYIGSTVTDLDGLVFVSESAPEPMGFDLAPNTLNLKSMGRWVQGTLEPEPPALPEDIDLGSILLDGSVPVDPAGSISIGDADGDGRPDLTVKFDRVALELAVEEGDAVTVTVTGTVGGKSFEGEDVIRVRRGHVSTPTAGSALQGGSRAEVRWDSSADLHVQSVAVLFSPDDGATWNLEDRDLPNTGSYIWTVPGARTVQARVAVQVESADPSGFEVDGVLGVSGRFTITSTLGVDGPNVSFALHGAVPNPSRGLNVSFSLANAGPAKLAVFDVGGREVSARQVGSLGAGRHEVKLGDLPAGIYLVQLSQGGQSLSSRVAVIR